MPTIKPGDIFFDKLPDGRYEKCILRSTAVDTLDRHVAARGGTGEFYRVINVFSEEEDQEIEDADEVVLDISNDGSGIPKFVMLKRI